MTELTMKNLLLLGVCIVMTYARLPAQPVKVMTYNIRYDNPDDGVNAWPNRLEKVIKLIATNNPDLIGVQEALHHQLDDMIKKLPQYAYIGVGRDDGKMKGEHSAILYRKDRFIIINQNTFWLSETPDVPGSKSWDAAITRVATWVKMKDLKTKKEFLMLNTHFDHVGVHARRNSAAMLVKEITILAGNLPVIVTGDFNFTRDDPAYNTMIATFTDPAPSSPPDTFCGFEISATDCKPIDYIFHSSHWRSEDYQVINDNDGRYYPSDHLPAVVKLEIN